MRLWTWQNKEFSLANKNKKYESSNYSQYLLESTYPDPEAREKHLKAYKAIWKLLGSDQLIWCFTNLKEALTDSEDEYTDCLLWELDIPKNEIQWYCEAAWGTLRKGEPVMPSGLSEIVRLSEPLLSKLAENYKENYNSYWSDKAENDLLNSLLLKKPVLDLGLPSERTTSCSGAIIFHPVDGSRITKNPFENKKWWLNNNQKHNSQPNNKNCKLVEQIPCLHCSAKNKITEGLYE